MNDLSTTPERCLQPKSNWKMKDGKNKSDVITIQDEADDKIIRMDRYVADLNEEEEKYEKIQKFCQRRDSLRIPVSQVASLSGFHPYASLPQKFMVSTT